MVPFLPPQPPLAALAARLLHRKTQTAPLFAPDGYSDRPLACEIDRLRDAAREPSDADLVRLLAKYAHAYVHDSEARPVSLAELTLLFDQFHHRRRGCESLDGRDDLRRRLLRLSFALTMIADLPKSARIVREILDTPLRHDDGASFLGLDIGTGTGILMLAMHLAACRAGYSPIRLVGVERDRTTWERTVALTRTLGIGVALLGDAKSPATYAALPEGPVHFVCNETLPSLGQRLWKEDFVPISQALFTALGERLAEATFFPAALWARKDEDEAVRLGVENGFAPASDYPLRLLRAEAIELSGEPVRLDRIGHECAVHVRPEWRERLGSRW